MIEANKPKSTLAAYMPHPPALRIALRRPAGALAHLVWVLMRRPSVMVCQSVHLTLRHCAELTLVENAFFTGKSPLLGDVQVFLWRLHPFFMRPDGELPNQRAPGGSRVLASSEQRQLAHTQSKSLARLVRSCDLFEAGDNIRRLIRTTGAVCGDDLLEHLDFLSISAMRTCGMQRDAFLDHPIIWLRRVLPGVRFATPSQNN